MANSDENHEPDWIKKVKSGGAVPFLEPDDCLNGWSTPPGDIFMVRGPEYLQTKAKVPGGDYLLKPLGLDWIKSTTKISGFLNNPSHRVMRVLEDEFPGDNKPVVWAFNIQVPTKDNHSVVLYFVSINPVSRGTLMEQFLNGDDKFRMSRLKLIANFVKGPWLLEKAIQRQPICIIGRLLTCNYCREKNFVEVDMDFGSTVIGTALCRRLFGYAKYITIDLAFLIEGHTEAELPERILGGVRMSQLDPETASLVEEHPDVDSNDILQPHPLSRRLWRSLGKGISKLIHQAAQENGSPSSLSLVNEVSDHEYGEEEMRKWLRLS